MKIVQSYWGKPTLQGSNEHKENRFNGGYSSAKYQYIGFALSCLKFRQLYDKVELYTDELGYKLLIEKLNLPYTNVHVCLDKLNYVPPLLWAMPKIYTYGLQDEPFIHADTDVFIWNKFDDALEQSPLLAQHLESTDYYKKALKFIFDTTDKIPEVIKNYDAEKNGIYSVNAGIFGGSDIAFIKEYSQEALRFFHDNIDVLAQSDKAGLANIIIEQYLFYRLATERGKTVRFLLKEVLPDYSNLGLFNLVPKFQQYIHLVGVAKNHHMTSSMIEYHLRSEFPEYYTHINSFFEEEKSTVIPVSKKGNDLDRFFEKTFSALDHYKHLGSPLSIKNYTELREQVDKLLALPLAEKVLLFLKDVFDFEDAKYRLNQECPDVYDEKYRYQSFCKSKNLLANNSIDAVLQRRFVLCKSIKLILINFDVPALTQEIDWTVSIEDKLKSIEAEEHIFMFLKKDEGHVDVVPIVEEEQIIYYFSQPITGNELVNFLAEDNRNPESIAFYRGVVYDIITKALTYGGHISFEEEYQLQE